MPITVAGASDGLHITVAEAFSADRTVSRRRGRPQLLRPLECGTQAAGLVGRLFA
jgi:hypothetical protein